MLVRTRPFHPVFDRHFDRSRAPPRPADPVVDAAWNDGALVLTVDLPGTPAEAIDVSVADRILTIAVNRTSCRGAAASASAPPSTPSRSAARYADGRLTVTVAAVASAEPRRVEISTEPSRHRVRRFSRRTAPATTADRPGPASSAVTGTRSRPAPPPATSPASTPGTCRASSAYGIRSRSTPTEQTTSTGEPSARRPCAEHGTRSLTLGRGTGGCAAASDARPMSSRILLQAPAQQPLGDQPVERVLLACRCAGGRRRRARRRRARRRSGRRRG